MLKPESYLLIYFSLTLSELSLLASLSVYILASAQAGFSLKELSHLQFSYQSRGGFLKYKSSVTVGMAYVEEEKQSTAVHSNEAKQLQSHCSAHRLSRWEKKLPVNISAKPPLCSHLYVSWAACHNDISTERPCTKVT